MSAPASPARRPGLLALSQRQGGAELKQFLRTREAVVFTMLFPVLLLVIFGAIFHGDLGFGVSFRQYFIAGIIASGLLAVGFQNLAISIPIERDRGVLKRFRGTPMPKEVYFIGKVLTVIAIGAAEMVLLLVIGALFYGLSLPTSASKWVTFAWVTLLGITAFTLLGIAFSSVPRTGRAAPAVVTPVALVLQFISGVFFVFTELPKPMQQIAAIFPLKWLCQGMRAVFLPAEFAQNEPAHSYELGKIAAVLGVWCIIGLVLCLLTFRWTSRREG